MAKVGLKETLALLAAGYKKKDIEALAAADEEQNKDPDPQPDPQPEPQPDPEPDPQPDPEPDYKQLYEDLKKQQEEKDNTIKEKDETIKKIQKENTNANSLPDLEAKREAEHKSLADAFSSFY